MNEHVHLFQLLSDLADLIAHKSREGLQALARAEQNSPDINAWRGFFYAQDAFTAIGAAAQTIANTQVKLEACYRDVTDRSVLTLEQSDELQRQMERFGAMGRSSSEVGGGGGLPSA